MLALAQVIDDFQQDALSRTPDTPEWPHRENDRAIGEWALAIHKEEHRERDEKFLKDIGISGGLN